jgi:hypothetical protein
LNIAPVEIYFSWLSKTRSCQRKPFKNSAEILLKVCTIFMQTALSTLILSHLMCLWTSIIPSSCATLGCPRSYQTWRRRNRLLLRLISLRAVRLTIWPQSFSLMTECIAFTPICGHLAVFCMS